MRRCHVLLFWDADCEGDPLMVCGMRLRMTGDGDCPPGEDFVGDFGRVTPKERAQVTCAECSGSPDVVTSLSAQHEPEAI